MIGHVDRTKQQIILEAVKFTEASAKAQGMLAFGKRRKQDPETIGYAYPVDSGSSHGLWSTLRRVQWAKRYWRTLGFE